MTTNEEQILPTVLLQYAPGDLIVKEGDYGISIYQIVEGKVGVYMESESKEVPITTLGRGEIIGEMIFLTGNQTRRSASVRAIEKTVLEAWHPSKINAEFDAIPFVIKYLTNQTVNQLVRMDRMMLAVSKRKAEERTITKVKAATGRVHQERMYRKDLSLDCRYRPIKSSDSVRLWGRVKNISKGGLRLDVRRMNALDYSHAVGDEFITMAYLPNNKTIEAHSKIANTRMLEDQRTLAVGMQFLNIPQKSEAELGFLLLG